MRLLLAAATAIATAALVLGPVTHIQIRAQQNRSAVPTASTPDSSAPNATAAAVVTAPTAPAVQVTDELVRARVFRSTPPSASQARPTPRPLPQRRSLLARFFLGAGDHRPHPFPRPRS